MSTLHVCSTKPNTVEGKEGVWRNVRREGAEKARTKRDTMKHNLSESNHVVPKTECATLYSCFRGI